MKEFEEAGEPHFEQMSKVCPPLTDDAPVKLVLGRTAAVCFCALSVCQNMCRSSSVITICFVDRYNLFFVVVNHTVWRATKVQILDRVLRESQKICYDDLEVSRRSHAENVPNNRCKLRGLIRQVYQQCCSFNV